jgi:hypothetical protein
LSNEDDRHTEKWIICQKYKDPEIRPAAASNKVYQLFAHGRWFSPGTPASSTTKTSRHDIAEILLKVALSTINQIKSTIEGYNRLEKIIRTNPRRIGDRFV